MITLPDAARHVAALLCVFACRGHTGAAAPPHPPRPDPVIAIPENASPREGIEGFRTDARWRYDEGRKTLFWPLDATKEFKYVKKGRVKYLLVPRELWDAHDGEWCDDPQCPHCSGHVYGRKVSK